MFAAAAVVVAVLVLIFYANKLGWFGSVANNHISNSNSSTTDNTNTENSGNLEIPEPQRPVVELPPLETVTIPSGAVVIPVVVHVVYNTREENISDDQVKSQIAVLNRNFRAKNDVSRVPAPFKELVDDAHIEFVLATTDPLGKPTRGITRTKTINSSFLTTGDEVHFSAKGGADAWPGDKYLNIWVCNLDVYSGYASLPGVPKDTDGVVANYRYFGTLGTAIEPFNRGGQVTHDIGHYLNLLHLWGDKSDCTGTDEVNDTPQQAGPNASNPSFPHVTCNNGPNGDMFMNFMDNTDDNTRCMFTKGQVLRMHQTLQGPRKELGMIKP